MKRRILFLVNKPYDSVFGERVRYFIPYIRPFYEFSVCYRGDKKVSSLIKFIVSILKFKPNVVYVIDIGYLTIITSIFAKTFVGSKIALDTGDIAYELIKNIGDRKQLILQLIKIIENFYWKVCHILIVRGSFYKEYLDKLGLKNVFVVQDGVDTQEMRAQNVTELRKEMGLDNYLTVGIMGSIVWSDKLAMCYGWEVVETIKILKDKPVKGIIIGDGNGIPILKSMTQFYGISDKIIFIGRIPHNEVSKWLSLIDICISTQTNDICGNIRTTVKLPEYLSCGRYVLATRVGEAKLVLPEEMLIPYEGVKDNSYPDKLAEKIKYILSNKSMIRNGKSFTNIAEQKFDYKVIGPKLLDALASI